MTVKPAPYPSDTRAKGWRFELDLERVEQSDTWALAAPGERPWLLMLWATAWKQTPCGSLPGDDAIIAAKVGMVPKAFGKARATLMRGWWLAQDGRLYHNTLVERVLEMMGRRRSDSDRQARKRAGVASNTAGVTRDINVTQAEQQRDSSTGTGTGTSYSVPIGTGTARAAPPPLVESMDERQLAEHYVALAAQHVEATDKRSREDTSELWKGAKSLLWLDSGMPMAKAGTLLGKLAVNYDEIVLTNAIAAMCRERPAGPTAWLKRACQLRAGEASKTNKQGRLEAANDKVGEGFLSGATDAPTVITPLETANDAVGASFLAGVP